MDDEMIIGLYFARSEDAIRETETKYKRLCFSVAYRVLANREDAEECVNDTFLHLWNSIPPNKPLSLTAYISKIARNLALNRYNGKTAKKRGGIGAIVGELDECVPDGTEAPCDMTEGEITASIERFLDTLTVEERVVFVKRYFYSEPIKSITAECGITKSKAESMLFRLRERLRKHLGKEGIDI